MVPAVNNMVLCIVSFKRVELMLGVLNTHTHTHTHTQKEGHNESPGDVGYVCYLDCGDDIMGVCMCLNASSCAH